MMNFLFYYVMVTIFVFNVVFIVCRCKCRRCGGKDEFVQKQGSWNVVLTHFLIITAAIVILIGCILTAFGNSQFKSAADDGITNLKIEKQDLADDFRRIEDSIFTSNSYVHSDYIAATGT